MTGLWMFSVILGYTATVQFRKECADWKSRRLPGTVFRLK